MGDNFLRNQIKNFEKGHDLAMQDMSETTLFHRAEIMDTIYTAVPSNGATVHPGEKLFAVSGRNSELITITRGHTKIASVNGDAGAALAMSLRDTQSGGVVKVRVESVSELSKTFMFRVVRE